MVSERLSDKALGVFWLHCEQLSAQADVDTHVIELAATCRDERFKTATVAVPDWEPIHLVATMPVHSTVVFASVTDGPVAVVRKAISLVESHSVFSGELGIGAFLRLDEPELLVAGRVGVLVVPVDLFPLLRDVPSVVDFQEGRVEFRGLMFLSAVEAEIMREQGVGALFDHFSRNGRDIYQWLAEVK